ncbi:hypothetical protein [Acetobacter peroxydans]|uniref:hypothetical protein n=1 Tax=Acetobacter peroxydans TaxID=104098 RepID=UPI002354062B|nr:hypothetical protein [Acetobacter peroxydans]MCH4142411.1 hypothetical protein [Acetobacter peroxydans]MCI1410307.1 hypothetical protein [Acetobacter peroxydans]MCI1438981.1 hypothetical protein [Acetobacter peroxydans]MCI1565792.1 hypothetical protein [Acetobacter peroxydans]MCI1617994.1 hypothetical protein [Acetobacter peroxydans]
MIMRDAPVCAGLFPRAARFFCGSVLVVAATACAGISGAGMASAQTVPVGGTVLVPETATAQPATQPDAPYVTPAVDTDITYVLTPAQDGLAPARQRMRWQVAGLKQRLDPEGGSVYMITTWKNRTLSVVDESRGRVSTMPMPGQQDLTLPGQHPASGVYVRVGQSVVAGEACQVWRTVDTDGHESDACYTADGILLQVAQQGRIMVRALTVSRTPQPDSVFEVPAGLVAQAPAHP